MKLITLIIACLSSLSLLSQVDSAFAFGFQAQLDGIRNQFNIEGMEAVVIFDGGCSHTAISGHQNGTNPIDPSKIWHAASNTKSLTATVILQLQEEGVLDIDDAVGMYINTNNWSGIDSNITIRQVLSHTSNLGIAWQSGSPLYQAVWANRDSVWNPRDVFLPQFQVPQTNFNGDWVYNPFVGYNLLGFLIEEVTGNTLYTEVNTRIFTPLNLSSSKFTLNGVAMNEFNGVWKSGVDRSTWSHNSYFSTRGGGGAWCANATDIASYFHHLHFGNILSPQSMAEAKMKVDQTPSFIPNTPLGELEDNYGLGTYVWTTRSATDTVVFYGHGGNGLSSLITASCPELGFTLLLVGNDFDKIDETAGGFLALANYVIQNMNPQVCQNFAIVPVDSDAELRVYPNPAQEVLHIENRYPTASEWKIFTVNGQEMDAGTVQDHLEIDVEKYIPGVYVLRLMNDKKVETVQWIKE